MDLLLEATARAEHDHFWFKGFRRFVTPLLAQAAAGRPGLRLLDCGCGTGVNLALLQQHGRAYGIDITWRGLQFAKARGHRRLARADAARLPFPDGQFDIVTSFDVIYSLPDDIERLAVIEMRRVLKPGGVLVLNVAALNVLRGNHSVLSRELRRYDRPGLRRLLEQAAFRVERMTYTNVTLFPVLLVVRSMQRWLGLKSEEDADAEITVPPKAVNGLLSAFLALEAQLVSRVDLPFGSSLLCVARKE